VLARDQRQDQRQLRVVLAVQDGVEGRAQALELGNGHRERESAPEPLASAKGCG